MNRRNATPSTGSTRLVIKRNTKVYYGKKATAVYEAIKRRIIAGIYAPRELLPKTDELAADLGASIATVNQAISRLVDEKYVSRKCGVGSRIEEVPVLAPPPKKNRDIGFYLPMLKGPDDRMGGNKSRVWIDIFAGALTAAGSRGYRLCAIPDLGGTLTENIGHYDVDSLIIYGGSNSQSKDFFGDFLLSGLDKQLKCLMLNRSMEIRNLNYLEEVSIGSMETALRRMAADGHRRIAMIGTDIAEFCYCRQYEAHKKVLAEFGVYSPELIKRIVQGSPPASYEQAVAALWNLPERPTALVVFRERFLDGTLAALQKLKIKVPEDLSLLVIDNECELRKTEVAAFVLPSKFEFGEIAVQLMIEIMNDQHEFPVNADLPMTFRPGKSWRALSG